MIIFEFLFGGAKPRTGGPGREISADVPPGGHVGV